MTSPIPPTASEPQGRDENGSGETVPATERRRCTCWVCEHDHPRDPNLDQRKGYERRDPKENR